MDQGARKVSKKFQKELTRKKVALFVCFRSAHAITEEEEKSETIGKARRKYLEEKAPRYNLHLMALGLFGGVWDFKNMSWWSKKTMEAERPKIEAACFKETKPRVYDTRDWNSIRSWAKKLAKKVRS